MTNCVIINDRVYRIVKIKFMRLYIVRNKICHQNFVSNLKHMLEDMFRLNVVINFHSHSSICTNVYSYIHNAIIELCTNSNSMNTITLHMSSAH